MRAKAQERTNAMQVVYSSQHYHVVSYPDVEGYELVNKPAGAGAYIHGTVASAFRENLEKVLAEDATVESIDEFLGGFDALMNQPTSIH
jgi:hypothetical protein